MNRAAIFLEPRAAVIDSHHDYFLHLARAGQLVDGFIQLPAAPAKRDVGSGGAKDILTVMKVEDRVSPLRLLAIGQWQTNANGALALQEDAEF